MLPSLNQNEPFEKLDFLRTASALLLLVVFFALLALLPKRDPTKVVAGLACSIVTEAQVGAVFGTRMRLMPTDGTVCHYVATNTSQQADMFVIALYGDVRTSDLRPPDHAIFVRRGAHTYEFVAAPDGIDVAAVVSRERRLASLLTRKELAQQ